MATEYSVLRDLRLLGEIILSSATSVLWPDNSIPGTALKNAADIARSQLAQEALEPQAVPLQEFRTSGTGALLGTAAGTPAGAMGLTYGTHGTGTPKLVGESASGNSKTNTARVVVTLPDNYDAGETITLRVRARITANANTSKTLDVEAFKVNGEAGVSGSDLYAGAAQALTTSWANYDYSLNPGTLSPGDEVDIELTAVIDDTGGANGAVAEIGRVQLLRDIRG